MMIEKRDKNLFRFFDWEVYNDAQEAFTDVLSIVRKLPRDLQYALGDQIIRSSLSVVLNIAEGSGRATNKELSRFFDIALGSINETMAGLDVLLRMAYITENDFKKIFSKYESISRQLGGFKKKLS